MAVQSQGVYIETIVCTDRCGSNKGQPELEKKNQQGSTFSCWYVFFYCDLTALISMQLQPQLSHLDNLQLYELSVSHIPTDNQFFFF